jgi:hypothetical protein
MSNVKRSGSTTKVHASTTMNDFGQYVAACNGVNAHLLVVTDLPVNCPKCIKLSSIDGMIEDEDEDEDEGCEGHESLNAAFMGVSIFCDGSCQR